MFSNPIADALVAFAELKPAPDDHEGRRTIARMLGLEWQPPITSTTPAIETPPPQEPIEFNVALEQNIKVGHALNILRGGPGERNQEPLPFEIRKSLPHPATMPKWLEEVEPLAKNRATTAAVPVSEPPPLFVPEWTRAILSTTLALRHADGPLDVPAIIGGISRGEAVTPLPRIERKSLARGVQLLVDRSEAMMPFAADVKWLEERFHKTAGSHAIQVMRFSGCPTRGAGPGGRLTWKPYGEWPSPRTGTTIVVVSDLGIVSAPLRHLPGEPEEWIDFANHVRSRSCPLVAIVPFDPTRWPEELVRHVPMIPWDRRTTASRVRALLGRGLRHLPK
jgi:hypothetical protein